MSGASLGDPFQSGSLSLLGFTQLALHFGYPPVPEEFRLRHALLGLVQGARECVVGRIHRGEGLEAPPADHGLGRPRHSCGSGDAGMHGAERNNGPAEHELGNDEQGNREVNDPDTVEQQGNDETEQVGASGHAEEREGVPEEVAGKVQDELGTQGEEQGLDG